MYNNALKKFISAALVTCLLSGQSFGQFVAPDKFLQPKEFTAVQDNTRMASAELNKKLAQMQYNSTIIEPELSLAANRIISLSSKGLNSAAESKEFNDLADKYIERFYSVISGNLRVNKGLYEVIYNAALPLLLLDAVLDKPEYYTKISSVYKAKYTACTKMSPSCDYDRAGNALIFLQNYDDAFINLSTLASLIVNADIEEDQRINFFQYAAPVMAHKGGRVHFESIINKLAQRKKTETKVTSGYIDPFVLVKIVDNSYQWIKEACSHEDGVWSGVCGQFGKDETKPFRQYKRYPVPAEINALAKVKNNATDVKVLNLESFYSKPTEPAQLATALRMYAEFYSDNFFWEDTFKFIYNAAIPEDAIVRSHRDMALAGMVLNAPDNISNTAAMRKYFAARINNDYFALDMDEELDANIKAALRNELGLTYSKLTAYQGQSPIKVTSDDGYPAEIKFVNNEKDIEGFWGSLFNFKDRPAEALSNVFIAGLLTKGVAKNGDKIFAALSRGFKVTGRLFTNMPAIVNRAKANYRALEYLAAKNGMGTARYAYRNTVYRTAAKKSAAAAMVQVEGRKAAEFFSSSHYNPLKHGNISRISKDIGRASSVGVTSLGAGGNVPSFINSKDFLSGMSPYMADLQKQQQVQQNLAAKYRGTKLPSVSVSGAKEAVALEQASIESAPHILPRGLLYSPDKSRFLSVVQNNLAAEDYLLRNTIYKGLKTHGFDFINLNTAKSFGPDLVFHQEGFLQASGKIGLNYNGFAFAKEGNLLGKASEAFASASSAIMAKTNTALAGVSRLIQTNNQLFKLQVFEPSRLYAVSSLVYSVPEAGRPIFDTRGFLRLDERTANPLSLKHFAQRYLGRYGSLYAKDLMEASKSVFQLENISGPKYRGSGFLVNYKGVPFIATAAHVAESGGYFMLRDYRGNKAGFAKVFARVNDPSSSNDLALLLPVKGALKGVNPLNLGGSGLTYNSHLALIGYPNEIFSIKYPKLSDLSAKFEKEPFPVILTDKVTRSGSSGGVLLNADNNYAVEGLVRGSNKSNSFFAVASTIKKFAKTALIRNFLDANFDQAAFLADYPVLSHRYSNLIEKYAPLRGSVNYNDQLGSSGAKLNLVSYEGAPGSAIIEESLPPFLRPQLKFEESTFKVIRSGGSSGSGFYINYRGMPVVITAGHVTEADRIVTLLDQEGKSARGTVLTKTAQAGYDLALILPEDGFLAGRVPFRLGLREPLMGNVLFSHGYPNGRYFVNSIVNVTNPSFKRSGAKYPIYETTPGSITNGSSGGALSTGDFDGTVVGVTYSLAEAGDKAYFTSLPALRKFLSNSAKIMIFDPQYRRKYLDRFPAFAANYANVLAKYPPVEMLSRYPVLGTPGNISVDGIRMRLVSSDGLRKYVPNAEEPLNLVSLNSFGPTDEQVESAIIKITRNSDGYGGSGFYINYRGLPVIVTASHVVRDDKFLKLYDSDGIFGNGIVFEKTPVMEGYDIALVMPSEGFLEGKTALNLSNRAPDVGELAYTMGFPAEKTWLTKTHLKLNGIDYLNNALKGVYLTMPEVLKGNSGGPLILPSDGNKVAGIAHMGGGGKGFFVTLPVLKDFLKDTFMKKFYSDKVNQRMLLKEYPVLASNYNNLISRYSNLMGTKTYKDTPVYETTPRELFDDARWADDTPDFEFPSAISDFANSTFKVQSLSGKVIGSGFYVNHRGVPMVITAGHVAKGEDVLRLSDEDGVQSIARVLSSSGGSRGYDVALLLTGDSFLVGRKPLSISGFAPRKGEKLFTYGFPEGGDFSFAPLTLRNTNFMLKDALRPVYEASPAVEKGYSGGPLGLIGGKVVGMGHMTSVYGSYFVTGPTIKEFIKTTFIKELANPAESVLLKDYPAFAKNYENVLTRGILGKYKAAAVKSLPAVVSPRLDDFRLSFTSFNFNNPLDYRKYFNNVRSGVIEVENSLYGKTGTGFYLRSGNMEALLTAGHVVKGADDVMIRPAGLDDKWFRANVVTYSLGSTDLGLLEISDSNFWKYMRPLDLASKYPQKGGEILSYGFPWGAGFEERLGIFKGFEPGYEGRLILASEHTAPGSSGGPVLYNGKVVGICKEGLCTEQRRFLPPNARNSETKSVHNSWEVIQTFLNNMVERRLPPSIRELRDKMPGKYESELSTFRMSEPSPLLLDPRGYGIKDRSLVFDGYNNNSQEDYIMDFGLPIGPSAKRFGFGLMTKVFGKSPRAALEKMYALGAKPDPYYKRAPGFTGEVYTIDNLDLHKAVKPADGEWPTYPFGKSRQYLFRGMSLNSSEVANILINGVRKVDMPKNNMAIMSAMATPGTNVQAISLSPYPQESAQYATVGTTAERGIPMMIHVKGITSANSAKNPHGVFTSTDITANQIVRASVMLNINGKNIWGELTLESGKLVFRPYAQ